MASIQYSNLIENVVIIELESHSDQRGLFVETWRKEWLPGSTEMVQANRADRSAGCLVGLHYHLHQADYWYVTAGQARVVLHDLRIDSPTEGITQGIELDGYGDPSHRGVYIPPGIAHGFSALTDTTITYFVDHNYDPNDELGLAWNDPDVAADWGIDDPILSERDKLNPKKSELIENLRPVYKKSF
tara:strand:- start:58 stop:618 length:561 start_codon:yes stop_codon:yes gene_type:complete